MSSSPKTRALPEPPPEAMRSEPSPKANWLFFFVGVIIFTVAMMLVSFPVGLYTVFVTHLSSSYTPSNPVTGVYLDLVFKTVEVLLIGNLGDVFLFCTILYLAFFLVAARQGAGLLRALKGAVSDGYHALFTNPLTGMLVLLGAASLVTTVVDTAQNGVGISTGSLNGDPFSLLLDFTIAPLTEETTFRMIMIGVPVLLLSLLIFRGFSAKGLARAIWRPSSVWDVDETEEEPTVQSFTNSGSSLFPSRDSDSLKVRAMKPVVYVFLALSSIMFGYAHYASGAGWGPGKISEAALAGLALGYLYIKYGFHADVLLHWSINYVGTIFAFFGQGVFGVPWTSNTGSFLDVLPTLDIVFLLGVPSTLIVANELMKRFTRKREKEAVVPQRFMN